jgi:type II secretory pathway pseudopilin PulG
MKIKISPTKSNRKKTGGFSIVEVSVGMGIIGTASVALFSGFTTGFFTM